MMRTNDRPIRAGILLITILVFIPCCFNNLNAAVTTSRPLLATGTNKCLVILVEFSGEILKKTRQIFSNHLFSTGTYSMTDYFADVSYDVLNVTGTVWGWYQLPQTRYYYADSESGKGTYPGNSQELVEDALDALLAVESGNIDFSEYDKDGDGFIDALFVVYNGYCDPYRTVDRNRIIPHSWELSRDESGTGLVTVAEGVQVNEFVVLPEISLRALSEGAYYNDIVEIGLFCFHYGSILGLPRLDDRSIDVATGEYTSYGLGDYCLMSNDYLGENRLDRNTGVKPYHLCAWSKCYMGWIVPTVVKGNDSMLEIDNIEENPEVYKVIANESLKGDGEYFLIANRQKKGFDSDLFGSGLLIYHVDETVEGLSDGTPNNVVGYKYVDLEEADGEEDLDASDNYGDEDDFFVSGDSFDSSSNPNSNTYPNAKNTAGRRIAFALSSISASADTMTASVKVKEADITVTAEVKSNIFTPNNDGYNDNIVFSQASGTYDYTIDIFDLVGRKVITLSNDNVWDGRDGLRRIAASGVYIYSIDYGNGTYANGTVVIAK